MRTLFDRSRGLVLVLALLSISLLGAALTLAAQQQDEGQQTRRQARGRLPNFYSQVVNGDQREKIYAIQNQYAPEVDKLREQLQELIAKRNTEIRNLLTEEQQARVDVLAEEARKRREANRAARRQNQEAEAAASEESTAESP